MKYAIAILIALVGGPVAFAQSIAQPASLKRTAILLDIEGLTDPNAARVLKWNDTSNEVEWAVDATGGGGSGDVDSFAADPSSNGNFSASAWLADINANASAARDSLGATSGVFPISAGGTGFGTAPSGILKGASGIITTATAGTDYLAVDGELTAIAGLTSAADRLPYFTGSGTASLATFTTFGRSLVDDADASAAQTTLGLVIGTNVAAYNAGLNLLGLLSDPDADRIPFWDESANAYAWLSVGSGLSITGTTITASGGGGGAPDAATYITQTADATLTSEQALGSLATGILKNTTTTGVLSIAAAGTDYVAPDAELTALAGLTSAADALPYFTGSGTASTTTLTTTARSLLDDTSATAMRATIGVAIGTAVQAYDVDLNSLSNGIVGVVKGLDDGNGYQAATLGTDYINNGSIDTSAELKSIVGDETGSGGALVFATGPTLSAPVFSTIVNTGTLTLPTSTDTLVGRATTDTLTNKTLTSPVINGFTGTSWDALRKRTRTFALFGATTDAATGDGAAYYPIPPELNGANITYVHLWAVTAGTTGTSDVQIARIRSGTPVDVLSTKVTIDSTEQGSDTAATAAVINTSNDDVATNDVLRVDVDALSSVKPKGLIVTIGFELQ